MTPQAQKVLDIINKDNGITRVHALHYDIDCITARISELRSHGYKIEAIKRVDHAGKKYSRWVLANGIQ